MFGRIGPMELILIFAIALIIFGPKKLPEIGRALGSALRNFKRHSESITEDLDPEESHGTEKRGPERDSSKPAQESSGQKPDDDTQTGTGNT